VLEMEKILRKYNLLKGKLEYYEEELQRFRLAKYSFASIVTNDKKMLYAKDLAKRYAKRKAPVLITGETGTGKELFAHAIHLASPSKNGPFIRVNCASIPHELLESELFGYESGAFTGAKKDGKPGKFELANHGTIFLDEIGSMDLGMQAKILRVLQDKELERLGSNKVTKVDFRVISATNKNLESLVKDEKFRLDLYYRLVVLSLDIPPLRERKNDIQLLCSYLIRTFNDELGTKISMIDEETMGILLNWDWPGNVRELRNVIERAVNLAENGIISVTHLPNYLARPSEHNNESIRKTRGINIIKEAKTTVERQMLDSTLSDTNWNISQSARDLGISRQLLYSLIRKYGLRKPGAR